MPEKQIDSLLDSAKVVSCEHTDAGYFLTVRHPALPDERVVCGRPLVIGRADGIECGFVVFLEGGTLTLECHSWGDSSVPEYFRERQVEITTTV